MDLSEMRLSEAQRYCDVVAGRGPVKLCELAGWLRADGVDLGQFDASLPSLVPLWEWFVDFALRGCPGVPDSARHTSFAQWEYDRPGVPPGPHAAWYVVEAVAHYLAAVWLRADPGASWQVYQPKRRNEWDRHRPMVTFTDGTQTTPLSLLVAASQVVDTPPLNSALRPDCVLVFATEPGALPAHLHAVAEQRGPSILADLPAAPVTPLVPWVALPAAEGGPLHPVPGDPARAGDPGEEQDAGVRTDELYLYRGKIASIDQRPGRLKPLDTQVVTAALAAMGFDHGDDQVEEAAGEGGGSGLELDLGEEGDELYDADATASLQITTHDHTVRALCLQLHNTPPAQAAAILDGYHSLAKTLKATVTAAEHIDWD